MDANVLQLLKETVDSPEIRGSSPDEVIPKVMEALSIADLDPVTQQEAEAVLQTYFQAIILDKDKWVPMPHLGGMSKYVQMHDFRLKSIPEGTHLVADVAVDKSDFETECFNRYVSSMEVRGKSVIFYALGEIPTTITIALKCVNADGNAVLPSEKDYIKKARF